MALKVFEGGFSQPSSWRVWEHHGRGVFAHCWVPSRRRTWAPCSLEQEAVGSAGEHGTEILVQIPAWVLEAVSAQQSLVLARLAGVADML